MHIFDNVGYLKPIIILGCKNNIYFACEHCKNQGFENNNNFTDYIFPTILEPTLTKIILKYIYA